MPGRRLDRPGTARQTIGLMGADGADAARARPILEQLCRGAARTCRSGRLRRDPQIHRQSAADGLMAGAGRGAGAVAFDLALDPARLMDLLSETSRRSATCSSARAGRGRGDAQGRRFRPGHLQCRRRHQGHAVDARPRAKSRGIDLPLVESDPGLLRRNQAPSLRRRPRVSSVSVYWANRGKR